MLRYSEEPATAPAEISPVSSRSDDSDHHQHFANETAKPFHGASAERHQLQQHETRHFKPLVRSSSVASSASSHRGASQTADDFSKGAYSSEISYRLGSAARYELDNRVKEQNQNRRGMEDDMRFRESCTFHPQINEHRQHVDPAAAAIRVEDRLMELSRQKQLKMRAAAMLKEEMEGEGFSFKPTIDKKSAATAQMLHPPSIRVEDRLMDYQRAAEESKRMLRRQLEERDERAMIRRPRRRASSCNTSTLNQSTTSSLSHREGDSAEDFLRRQEEALQRKKAHEAALREAELTDCTFKPKISEMSRLYTIAREGDLASQKARSEALYEDAAHRAHSLHDRRQLQAEEEANRKRYQPHVSAGSAMLVRSGAMREMFTNCNFVERQQVFQNLAKQHGEQLKKQQQTQRRGINGQHVTTPAGSKMVSLNCSSIAPQLSTEENKLTVGGMHEQVERLYAQSMAVSRDLQRELKKRVKAEEGNFRPTLAPATEALMKTKNMAAVVERLTAFVTPTRQRRHTAEVDEPSSPKSVLKKEVDAGSALRTPHRKVSRQDAETFYQRQLSTVQRRKREAEAQQQERLVSELKDCTFQPDIQPFTPFKMNPNASAVGGASADRSVSKRDLNSSIYSTSEGAAVQGVDLFLKRQERARSLRQSQETAVNSLGKGLPCNGPNYTLVRPFRLSNGGTSSRSVSAPQRQRFGSRSEARDQNAPVGVTYPFHGSRGLGTATSKKASSTLEKDRKTITMELLKAAASRYTTGA